MYKLFAVWSIPTDVEGFERHYVDVHLPLVATIPGVRKVVTTRTSDALGGGVSTLQRITELWFDDHAALEAAEASPEGQATIADAGGIQARFGATLTSVAGVAEDL